ncbi:Choline-phosphate cytidylyltransferase 1, partial [Cucurbita argyrosperma subsp. sororia]
MQCLEGISQAYWFQDGSWVSYARILICALKIQTVGKNCRYAAGMTIRGLENADRWVAGFLESLKKGTAIRDRIQERLMGAQHVQKYLSNGKDSDYSDLDEEYYYDDEDNEEYYDDDDDDFYEEFEKDEKEKGKHGFTSSLNACGRMHSLVLVRGFYSILLCLLY